VLIPMCGTRISAKRNKLRRGFLAIG